MRKFTRNTLPQSMQEILDKSKTRRANEKQGIFDFRKPDGQQYEVTVELSNGLGNRIFQILAAIGYGEKYKKTPVICRAFSNDGPKSHEKNLHDILIKIFPKIKVIDSMSSFNIVSERQYFNYMDLVYYNTDVVLKGYFQAEGYLPSPALIPDIRTKFYNNIYFIHIRAGDYLLFQNEWGIDVPDYLKKCFYKINNNNIKYIVFSDDVEYARVIMSEFNVNYVFSDKTDPYETIVEMANCAGGICANSSFSWLGALFQKGQNKSINPQIFMPSIWNKTRDCSGVYPKWACIINANPSLPSKTASLSLRSRAIAMALTKIPSSGINMAEAITIAGQIPDRSTYDKTNNPSYTEGLHTQQDSIDSSFLVEELVRRAWESNQGFGENNPKDIPVHKSRKTIEEFNYEIESKIQGLRLAQVTSPEIRLPMIRLEDIRLEDNKLANGLVSVEIDDHELGNKIFMILAGMGYAEKYNKEFVFCKALFNKSMSPNEKRHDEILTKLFPNISWIDSIGSYVTLREEVMLEYRTLPNNPGNVLLSGYFQNEGYFPSKSMPKIRTSSYKEYFVDIRRGDYLEDMGEFNKIIYYTNCFDILGPDISYIIFSDDNSYADNYMKQFNVKYILSEKMCPVEILIEMSNCAGGICINSTFSWLAGFFQGKNIGKIFFPSLWNRSFPKSSKVLGEWANIVPVDSYSNRVIKTEVIKYNSSSCKLSEWQNSLKEPSSLILQGSSLCADNLWMPFPIGISWQYVKYFNNNTKSWQFGSHENLVLCAISPSTQSEGLSTGINQEKIIDTLRNNNIQNINLSGENYFSSLPSYKFVISPQGTSIDCHMHYEALLAGCIPIIEYNYKIVEKYKGCPVLYTKDYSEITYDYLENKYKELTAIQYDFSRLFIEYYSKEEQEEIKKYITQPPCASVISLDNRSQIVSNIQNTLTLEINNTIIPTINKGILLNDELLKKSRLIKIPLNIFQTWKTKNLSRMFQDIVDTWKIRNPEYKYELFDDNDCEEFIKQYFDEKVYYAYSNLKFGAFKADLFRYCVLYIYGGVYADIDTICINKLEYFLEGIDFATPIDFNTNVRWGKYNLFNAFIASVPRHPILLDCINRIVYNMEHKIIPSSSVDLTGPGVLGRAVNTFLKKEETSSFINREGTIENILLLKFEMETEYIRNNLGHVLFQNKNGNKIIKGIYDKESRDNNMNLEWDSQYYSVFR